LLTTHVEEINEEGDPLDFIKVNKIVRKLERAKTEATFTLRTGGKSILGFL